MLAWWMIALEVIASRRPGNGRRGVVRKQLQSYPGSFGYTYKYVYEAGKNVLTRARGSVTLHSRSIWYRPINDRGYMAKQIEKVLSGVLTANAEAAPGVKFVLPNGTTHEVDLSKLPEAVVVRLAVHGLSQKIGDSYAGAGKAEDPIAYADEAIRETIEQLLKGEWRVASIAGAAGPKIGKLVRAVARAFGITVEAAASTFEDKEMSLSEEEYKAFVKTVRADAGVKKALADITAEEAAEELKTKGSALAAAFGAA